MSGVGSSLKAGHAARYLAQDDRAKGIAAYEALLARGDSNVALNNLAGLLDNRRDFARAESLYRASIVTNPELSLPDSIMEDLLAVGTFRLKEKPKNALGPQAVRDWSFAEKAKNR